MSIDERSQAALLEQFLLDPAATPPTGLDTGVAATATLLAERLTPAGPSPEFVRKLEQQLTAAPPTRAATPEPTAIEDWKARPRRVELLRIAAAGLIILLLGSLLIYLFSSQDDDRPQVAAPGGFTDGELLVSWDPNGGENYKLYIVPTDGSEPRKLTPDPHEDDGVTEEYGVWSPDGRWVAYTRKEGDKWELFIAPTDRHIEPRNLTRDLQSSIPYGWSPDGTQVLFSSRGEHNIDIHVVNSDGTSVRNLTDSAEDGSWGGAWSPDGQQIAYSMFGPADPEPTGPRGEIQTWVMDIDGSNQHQLTALPGLVQAPVWSPDGQWLAFWYGSDIWIVNPDGENLTNLTNDVLAYDEPAWANDWNQIAYATGNMAVGSSDIVVIATDGDVIEQWTPDADRIRTPTWSPDDQQFAYLAGNLIDPDSTTEPRDLTLNDYNWRIEIATVDGENRQVILEGGILTSRPPAWNPAGKSFPPAEGEQAPPTDTFGWPESANLSLGGEVHDGMLAYGCNWFDLPACTDPAAREAILKFPDDISSVPAGSVLDVQVEDIESHDLALTRAYAVPLADADVQQLPEGFGSTVSVAFPPEFPLELQRFGDAMQIVAGLPQGDYAIGVDVVHTPDNGTATYGFHIRIVEAEPEANNYPTFYDDAEVLHVVSVMVNVTGQEFETHTWVNQTNGDAIVQRYLDGTLWETLLRRGRTLTSYNQESISRYEYLSESDPALENVTRELFTFRDDLQQGTAVVLGEEEYQRQPALKITRTDSNAGSGDAQMVWLDPKTLFPLGSGPDSPVSFTYPVIEALAIDAMPDEIFDMEPPDTVVRDFNLRQLTIDEAQEFDIFSVWWLEEEWNGFRLERIEYTTTTLVDESEVMHLVYVDTETGQQGIVLSAHGELREWQVEDWQNGSFATESIEVGMFSGWLYASPPSGLVVLHIGDGTHYLKMDAPDRETAVEAVEALVQMNGQ